MVCLRSFKVWDYILRKTFEDENFESNWEGPFLIAYDSHKGVHKLQKLLGTAEPKPWNASHLKKYYM